MYSIGDQLRGLRKKAKMTMDDVYARYGIYPALISKIEQNKLDKLHVVSTQKYSSIFGYELSLKKKDK